MKIREGIKNCWLACVLILLGAQIASGQDREFHQTYDLAEKGSVAIYNTSGAVRVSSWNEARVKVDAVKRGRNEADFAKVQIEVSPKPERVEIRVIYPSRFNWRGGGVSVDFDVKVPRGATVNPVNTTSGDLTITGPIERVAARATSGNISVQDITDTANLNSTSGDVTAARIGGEIRANATSGTLTITDAGSRVFATASSGAVRITNARDDVSATVSSGDIKLEKIGGRAIVRSNSGWVVINDVGGDVQATSMTDDVSVSKVKGRVVVSVISGNITLREIAEGIKATAVSGAVNISDSSGRIEVVSTSDSVILTNLDSKEVIAKSTSGNVQFTGKIHEGGNYELESFNGEVLLTLSPESHFTVSAQTWNGSLNTEFPLQLTRSTGGNFLTGTVGKGGADIRLKSFNGSVRIRKSTR
ncbi:MAG: DUF4097 family beta strand repeat-containing protein [Acidobacteriota bacterium]|nr:DUF4097 family beta strand repeat-containing protein [Acidobacteriota bacterium]